MHITYINEPASSSIKEFAKTFGMSFSDANEYLVLVGLQIMKNHEAETERFDDIKSELEDLKDLISTGRLEILLAKNSRFHFSDSQ